MSTSSSTDLLKCQLAATTPAKELTVHSVLNTGMATFQGCTEVQRIYSSILTWRNKKSLSIADVEGQVVKTNYSLEISHLMNFPSVHFLYCTVTLKLVSPRQTHFLFLNDLTSIQGVSTLSTCVHATSYPERTHLIVSIRHHRK